jgi:mannosyltransferase OCH1-like enzyme
VGAEMTSIERKMYPIWIGPNPAPMKWLLTWKEKHPDWDFKIFTDDHYKDRTWKNQHLMDHYYKLQKWQGVADLIRYELLLEKGGFIPEADIECLNPIDELLTGSKETCYTCYENEDYRPGYIQPFFAANPQNLAIKYVVNILHQLTPSELSPEPFRSTGNQFLSKIPEDYKKYITIWPSHYFIPQFYTFDSKRYNGPDKIYGEHYWGSTGMRGKPYSEGIS